MLNGRVCVVMLNDVARNPFSTVIFPLELPTDAQLKHEQNLIQIAVSCVLCQFCTVPWASDASLKMGAKMMRTINSLNSVLARRHYKRND